MRRVALMALTAAMYMAGAWMVAPGFYDGIEPIQPYNFVCPPPAAGAGSGIQPSSAHLDIKVINGVSDANSAVTDDGQVAVGFPPGAFDVTGKSNVSVDITPVRPCPKPAGLHFATNTYLISADAPLVKGANLVMAYSAVEPDPSFVYSAASANGPWTNIGSSQQARFWTIQPAGLVTKLDYFAAGYPSNAVAKNSLGNQLLPTVIALLIVGVLVAGIPLAVIRRRREAASADDLP